MLPPVRLALPNAAPHDPNIGLRYFLIGTVRLLQSRTDEAIIWLEKARSAMPASPLNHRWLASAMLSKAKANRLPPNSPKPGNWTAESFFQASTT